MNDTDFKSMVMDAVDKLLIQGEQSKNAYDSCVYRSEGGLCCIVGFMMDDETAERADKRGESTVAYLVQDGIWGEHLSELQVNQLGELQGCHDSTGKIKPFNEDFISAVKATPSLSWVAEYIEARE